MSEPSQGQPGPMGVTATPIQTSSSSTAFIGESIHVKGSLTGSEDLIINGHVEGNIELRGGDLVIGRTGKIRANLLADDVLVDGEVAGDIVGTARVVVSSEGRVRGNIIAPRVTLEDGAQFKGRIDMDPIDSDSAGSDVEPPLLQVDAG